MEVINSGDSGAADREVYVRSTEHDWIHVQDERTGLPPRHISCAMDSDNRDFVLLGMQLRDRARKHEHHAKANKYFAEDFLLCMKCLFHFVISFVGLAFRDFSLLKTHFGLFTEVLQEFWRDITRKFGSF